MDMFSAEYLDEVQAASDAELWEGAKSYSGLAKANVFYELSRRAYGDDDCKASVDLSAVAINEYLSLGSGCPWDELIEAYTVQAINLGALEQYDAAADGFAKSVELMRKHQVENVKDNLFLYALYLGFANRFDEAIAPYLEVIELSQFDEPETKLITVFRNLGDAYTNTGKLAMAEEYLKRAIEVAKNLRDGDELAFSLNSYGMWAKAQLDFTKGIEYFDKAFNVNETLGNNLEAALNQFEMGECWFNLARFDLSVKAHTKSL